MPTFTSSNSPVRQLVAVRHEFVTDAVEFVSSSYNDELNSTHEQHDH